MVTEFCGVTTISLGSIALDSQVRSICNLLLINVHCMYVCIVGWMDVWMGEWVDGFVCLFVYLFIYLFVTSANFSRSGGD